jgi:bilirubin oxidase
MNIKMKRRLISNSVFLLFFTLFSQAQNPLMIPPLLNGPNFNLTVAYDSVEFYPGVFTHTAGVNGPILGPTLIIDQGQQINATVTNLLNDTTTMHWHGAHVPAAADGGPHSKIAPNSSWSPSWTAMDRASTMWYHPHLHHKTYKHVMMGVAGLIINRDPQESALALPRDYGVDDFPLVLQTKVMDANQQIDASMMNYVMDTLLLVNGTRNPYLDAPAQLVRFRVLNGSAMRTYNFGISNNDDFWVIGSDGGLLEAPVQLNRLLISPGERYEIVVDLSNLQGQSVDFMNYGTGIPSSTYGAGSMMGGGAITNYSNNPLNGLDFTLLTVNVTAPTANAITSIPSTLIPTNPFDQFDVDTNRQFTFTSMGGQSGPFMINSTVFDMNQINYVIPLDNKETWTFFNQTPIAHPFHIHDVQFNILEINGTAPPAHMQGWKDVLLIPGHMGSAKFITKFEDFADPEIPYMYHCHMLVHEDEGMMGQFLVVDNSSFISSTDLVNGKQLLKVVDVLGKESNPIPNTPLFYIYDDGSVEKILYIE